MTEKKKRGRPQRPTSISGPKDRPQGSGGAISGISLMTDHDIYLFKEGTHYRLYEKLGSHIMEAEGRKGTLFALWAPNAASVSVVGDFNGWNENAHPLAVRWDGSGIWEGFIPDLGAGTLYKYRIKPAGRADTLEKSDPFAFHWETSPKTASVVWDLEYDWHDEGWMADREEKNALDAPCSVYEVHLGSWMRGENNTFLTYREMAPRLVDYVTDLGFTHVELSLIHI